MTALRRPLRLLATTGLAALAAISLVACGSDDSTDATTAAADTTAVAPVVIEVDADSGTAGTQTVPLGSEVSLHIVSATDQEFHLHGYDVEDEGTDVTITFVADQAGSFQLESHATDTLLFTLVVTG